MGEHYNFDRDRIEAEEIGKLTKQDVLAFYRRFISHKSKERRKLATHVVSVKEDGAGGGNCEDEPKVDRDNTGTTICAPKSSPDDPNNNEKVSQEEMPQIEVIEDITEFKRHHPLFPTLKPYADPESFNKAKTDV